MAAGAQQGSTTHLVMLETWPRETLPIFFGPIYRTSTVNMQQRSIAYQSSQYYNGDNLGLFLLHTIIRTYLHHSRSPTIINSMSNETTDVTRNPTSIIGEEGSPIT